MGQVTCHSGLLQKPRQGRIRVPLPEPSSQLLCTFFLLDFEDLGGGDEARCLQHAFPSAFPFLLSLFPAPHTSMCFLLQHSPETALGSVSKIFPLPQAAHTSLSLFDGISWKNLKQVSFLISKWLAWPLTSLVVLPEYASWTPLQTDF